MPQPSSDRPFTNIYHKKPYPAIDPTQKTLSAVGKTILITAGHTGIGYAIAQNFAIAGATNIILLARRLEVLENATKALSSSHPETKFFSHAASITDFASIKRIFHQIRTNIANPNILVTSAAYVAKPFAALALPLAELSNSFETNVLGNINLVKVFLAESETGVEKIILDISSFAAHLYLPQISAYSITKLAFTQFLTHVQEENKNKGVRVHSFHPGVVLTDAVRGFGMTEETMDWEDVQLSGQFGVWLASKEAEFLKGRFVWANWDVEEMIKRKFEFELDSDLLKSGLVGATI
jgi:short-subunit dehydrogenase